MSNSGMYTVHTEKTISQVTDFKCTVLSGVQNLIPRFNTHYSTIVQVLSDSSCISIVYLVLKNIQ